MRAPWDCECEPLPNWATKSHVARYLLDVTQSRDSPACAATPSGYVGAGVKRSRRLTGRSPALDQH